MSIVIATLGYEYTGLVALSNVKSENTENESTSRERIAREMLHFKEPNNEARTIENWHGEITL